MPFYYFHLADLPDIIRDTEGVELDGIAAAITVSLNTARDIMSSDILAGHLNLELRLDVEDEAGRLVHEMSFAEALTISFPKHG